MNEMNLSSFIQIIRTGLMVHDKQESAGRFLLESVTMQENSLCTTNLDSKKISNLVSRKDPVPDDIRQAALKNEVAAGVKDYFETKVLKDLNIYTQDDVIQKLMNVIVQDVEMSQRQKENFQKLFDSKDDMLFLYSVFMYVLQRNNKKASDTVEYQDAPLLAEVNYECPIKHVKLVEEVKGIPKKNYVITQIFPKGLSQNMSDEFDAVCTKPKNLDASANLIALSTEASEEYLLKPTVEEYKNLCEIKKLSSKRYKASMQSIGLI